MKFVKVSIISFLAFVVVLPAWALNIPIETSRLKNGIEVLTISDPQSPTVSLQIFVRAGSRDEVLPHQTGLAHIFEHLMFRGTPKYPNYDDAIIRTGAQNNADTANDRTRFFENAKSEHLHKLIEVEADRFKHLNFNQTAFDNELGPVRQEREKGTDNNPSGFLGEQLINLAYTTHTYKHDTIGSKEDIINMRYQDAYNFYNTFYRPPQIFIVVAGKFNRQQTLGWLEHFFGGDWQRQPYAGYNTPPPVEPPQTEVRRANYVWKDSLTPAQLLMAFHIPSMQLKDNTFCALELSEMLLFLESSPLYRRLVQELELVPPGGIGGGAERVRDPGLYSISALLREGKGSAALKKTEKEILAAIDQLRNHLATPQELAKARNNYFSSLLFSLNSASSKAASVGELYIQTDDPQAINKLIPCYESVTAEDIRRVAQQYLDPKHRTVLTLLPKESR